MFSNIINAMTLLHRTTLPYLMVAVQLLLTLLLLDAKIGLHKDPTSHELSVSSIASYSSVDPIDIPPLPPYSVGNCTLSDVEFNALESIYNSTGGPNWVYGIEVFDYNHWTFPANASSPCTDFWHGVICDYVPMTNNKTCYVQRLLLFNLNLQGTLPPETSELKNASVIMLSYNKLKGSFPTSILSLSNLIFLDICFNHGIIGTIPKEISQLVNLKYLFMYNNHLHGPIPSELGLLSNLKIFDLDQNLLSGPLPTTLGQIKSLEVMYLNSNLISGSIPSELSQLTKLNTLDLDTNRLIGRIPPQLSALSNLGFMFLENNQLTGPIDKDLFRQMPDLVYFQINNNSLTGTLPRIIGNLGNLHFLDVSENYLTGTIPDSYTNLISLRGLMLSYNSFSGKFPEGLSNIGYSLKYLDVSVNNFYGDPFIFSGFPFLINVNISNNHFDEIGKLQSFNDSGIIDSLNISTIFNCTRIHDLFPYVQGSCNRTLTDKKSLQYLDISSNYLPDHIPDSFGSKFPHLNLLIASNNCFYSHIPETLCLLSDLSSIILNNLGSRCSSTSISNVYNLLSSKVVNQSHTIPSCLLQLPNLKTAHFISNRLYGTLPEVSESLISLNIVGNLIKGTIPMTIYSSKNMLDLKMSLNRLSGTLASNAFSSFLPNSTVWLYSNRISGNIPTSMIDTIHHFNVLEGNLFSCIDPPINDENSGSYECGSNSINDYKYFFIAVGIIFVIKGLLYYFRIKLRNMVYFLEEYFHFYEFPGPWIKKLIKIHFFLTILFLAVIFIFINLSMRPYKHYTTLEITYGWATTFAYVHGIFPYLLVCFGLILTIFVFLYFSDDDDLRSSTKGGKKGKNKIGGLSSLEDQKNTVDDHSLEGDSEKSNEDSEDNSLVYYYKILKSLCSNKGFLILNFFMLIAITVTTFVNILYILVENTTDPEKPFYIKSKYKFLTPILLSIFKLFWSNTYVVFMLQYSIRAKLPPNLIFGYQVFILMYMYVLAPIFTVYFTDVSCFYFTINKMDTIEESYDVLRASSHCIQLRESSFCFLRFLPTPFTNEVTPSWLYGYQCGSSLLVKYIPTVLAKYTISGIFVPIFRLIILFLPSTSFIRSSIPIKMFMPFTSNALEGGNLSGMDQRSFRSYRYLSALVIDVATMLTYGVASPFLMFIIFLGIATNQLFVHLQLGSCSHDWKIQKNSNPSNESSSDSGFDKMDPPHIDLNYLISHVFLDNLQYLFLSTWKPTVFSILLFWVLILFDMLADVYTNIIGIFGTICFAAVIGICFTSKKRLTLVVGFVSSIYRASIGYNSGREKRNSPEFDSSAPQLEMKETKSKLANESQVSGASI